MNSIYDEAEYRRLGVKGISLVKVRAKLIFEAPVIFHLTEIRIRTSARFGAYSFFRGGRVVSLKSIGRYCSVAPGVSIGDGEHPISFLSTHQFQYGGKAFDFWPAYREGKCSIALKSDDVEKRPPVIGNDVWIGANVFIARGVTIGDGAVIAAGAVVVKDVAPYMIVGGVPAKVIRPRFEQAIIDDLLDLKWWNYDLGSMKGLPFRNVPETITKLRRRIGNGRMALFEPVLVETA